MRVGYKNLIIALCLAAFAVSGSCFAINDNSKTSTKNKTQKVQKNKKSNKNSIENKQLTGETIFFSEKTPKKNIVIDGGEVILNNENHSVFTLDDCIKIAIEYNPRIKSAIYDAQAYKSKIGQAWSNYFPVFGVGIEGTRSGSHYSDNTPSSYTTMGYFPKATGEMLLFDFGKTKAGADKAKKYFESKESDTKESINTIIYEIKTAYYNLLFAKAQVKVYEETVNDYELQLQRAKSFYQIGRKPKIDVITAEYNLGKAKLNFVKAKNILDVAHAQLTKIMGVPEYTNYEISSDFSDYKYNITQEDVITKAFEVRPELISAKKMTEAAKLDLREKRREYTPNLGAFASFGNGRYEDYNMQNYQVGLSLEYSALNILRVKKQIDEAGAVYKKSLADLETVKHDVYMNVKQAYLDLMTSGDAIKIAKLALDEAEEQYLQVSGRYKAGVGDIIELKDGENTYLNARLDFYNTLLKYNIDAAFLEKEIGAPLVASDERILENLYNEEQPKENTEKNQPSENSASDSEKESI